MSKRRLWTLENNLSFALFSSFASRKRRRCVRFEKRNLSLVSPLAKSLKMRTNKLATLFRSSTRSFSSFKERERNYYDGKTVLVSLLLSFSLSPSLSVSLCKRLCRCDYAGKNAREILIRRARRIPLDTRETMRDAKRNNSRDIPRNVYEKGRTLLPPRAENKRHVRPI